MSPLSHVIRLKFNEAGRQSLCVPVCNTAVCLPICTDECVTSTCLHNGNISHTTYCTPVHCTWLFAHNNCLLFKLYISYKLTISKVSGYELECRDFFLGKVTDFLLHDHVHWFLPIKSSQTLKFTNLFHPVPEVKMCGALPPLQSTSWWCGALVKNISTDSDGSEVVRS